MQKLINWRVIVGLILACGLYLAVGFLVSWQYVPLASSGEVHFSTETLSTLPEWERIEQIRDWVMIAYLVEEGIPPERISIAFHNQPPLRNPALAEVYNWQYGVGRWAWVPEPGRVGDLYCFLPEDADQRLLGLLADDFRRLTGRIPEEIHYIVYRIEEGGASAYFSPKTTFSGGELFKVGGRFGYHERVIRNRADLDRFLKEIDLLTYVNIDKGKLILGGRDLPGWSSVVDVEDVAVLYQAYCQTDNVGFSLDPAWLACCGLEPEECFACALTCALLGIPKELCPYMCFLAALPDELPGVPQDEWEKIKKDVERAYLFSLHQCMKKLAESDIDEARAGYQLLTELLGKYVPQCARYDGTIRGTKVGMTLFYCDLLAKLWVWDYERAAPRQIGILPELELSVAPAYWPDIWRLPEGRLWFEVDYSKLQQNQNSLFLSPFAIKIFAAANDPERPGEEVPSRDVPELLRLAISLWNASWPRIIEYEPEYLRLNELQKWSAFIAWLKAKKEMDLLSFLDASVFPITGEYEFPEWLENNRSRLSFKGWLPFVESCAGAECLSIICSQTRPAFGSSSAFLSGGVSLSKSTEVVKVAGEEEFFKFIQDVLSKGEGTYTYPNGATYAFLSKNKVSVTPPGNVALRSLALDYTQKMGSVIEEWQGCRFSSILNIEEETQLDATLNVIQIGEGRVNLETVGTAFVVESIAQFFAGRGPIPGVVKEMYYDADNKTWWIETEVGWFKAEEELLSQDFVKWGSPVTSYIKSIEPLSEPPRVSPEWAVDLKSKLDDYKQWQEVEGACLIIPFGNYEFVPVGTGFYPISRNSLLWQALTGQTSWPTDPSEAPWWPHFQEFVGNFFSHVRVPWEITGTEVVVRADIGDIVIKAEEEFQNFLSRWLKFVPITRLEFPKEAVCRK